jgi:8-hydroxy-5-deazaflavin:NADPH oxidoreductase
MKIGIIGAGKMGGGLSRFWVAKGHQVKFSFSNTPGKLDSLAQALGSASSTGTPAEASEWADLVLLAVPWPAVDEAIAATSGKLVGKNMISCVTPIRPDFSGLEVGTTTSAAEIIAAKMPDTTVAEVLFAFAELLHSGSVKTGNDVPSQFYCGDDGAAKAVVASLISEIGLEPVDCGPLRNARYLEPNGMLLVQLAYSQGLGGLIGSKLLHRLSPIIRPPIGNVRRVFAPLEAQ